MIHYGDVCKINGAEVEPVEFISYGSPCQDVSIAGRRAGLKNKRNGDEETTRSGLFFEAIRIIKEMRNADIQRGRTGVDVRPRFSLLENVPGLLSSNGGEDFRTVLEETARVADNSAVIPRYEGGRWKQSGVIMGDGWSVAWRVFDAQFWGVPQRRRRIALVADFNGMDAAEILFERDIGSGDRSEVRSFGEGLSWDSEPGGAEGEGATGDFEGGTRGEEPFAFQQNGDGFVTTTPNFNAITTRQNPCGRGTAMVCYPNDPQSKRVYSAEGTSPTLNAGTHEGMNIVPSVIYPEIAGTLSARFDGSPQPDKGDGAQNVCYNPWDAQSERVYDSDGIWHSLSANEGGGQSRDAVLCAGFKAGNGGKARGIGLREEVSPSLTAAESGTNQVPSVICIQGNCIDRADTAGCNGRSWRDDGQSYTLNTIDRPAVCFSFDSLSSNSMKSPNPHSGCRRTEEARTLDASPPDPSKNQGGIAVVYDARGNGDGENVPTITGDHQNRVTDYTAICINGEVSGALDASYYKGTGSRNGEERAVVAVPDIAAVDCRNGTENPEVNGTLLAKSTGGTGVNFNNIVRVRKDDYIGSTARSEALRILQETYGAQEVVEWGAAIMAALQQAEVLRKGVLDIGDEVKTENRKKLDDNTLPCAELVAGWLLRDLREQSKCGCSSQGRESAQQCFGQSTEIMPQLSCEGAQRAEDLFYMWESGQGLGVLQQTLFEIQEIWESIYGQKRWCNYKVRRLTPLEAERLQGYFDSWTDIGDWIDSKGKKHKTADSARYRALGNSIALPSWFWLLSRLNGYCREHTMASLFDGIGGFPLIWEHLNGRGSCLWASEIEEFCIAVTTRHFGDESKAIEGDLDKFYPDMAQKAQL